MSALTKCSDLFSFPFLGLTEVLQEQLVVLTFYLVHVCDP